MQGFNSSWHGALKVEKISLFCDAPPNKLHCIEFFLVGILCACVFGCGVFFSAGSEHTAHERQLEKKIGSCVRSPYPQKIIFHALFVRESQLRRHIHVRTLRLEWTRWASAGSQGTAPSPTAQTWVSRKFEKGSTAEILTSHSSCRFLQFKNQAIFYSGCISFCFLLTWKFSHPIMKDRLLEGFDIRMWWDYTTCP